MCGIVGYIGKEKAPLYVLNALQRLEYRGYDSCGLAYVHQRSGQIVVKKDRGKIQQLKTVLHQSVDRVHLGIAHTRWATHGFPTKKNAHPHLDCTKTIALVHNGIIENYQELKEVLIRKKHCFVSQTDTEVIVHLLEEAYLKKDLSLQAALQEVAAQLKGSFAVAAFCKDEEVLVGMRKNSPLVVGIGEDGMYLASDVIALAGIAHKVIYLDEETVCFLTPQDVRVFSFSGEQLKPKIQPLKMKADDSGKGKYRHYMLKEISEQPEVIERLLGLYIKHDEVVFKDLPLQDDFLQHLRKIYIVGCGTAYHAGLGGKYFLERFSKVNVEIDVSSEFRYRNVHLTDKDLIIAISQSGETADTLAAVKLCKKNGARIVSICNTLASSLTRESDGVIFTHCGPEVSVASTKAYTAQLTCMLLFALYLSQRHRSLSIAQRKVFLDEIKRVPGYQRELLSRQKEIQMVSRRFSRFGCFLFLGRNINYPSALEGALKLKEISYIPAEGYAAGEMKHGPIALIDEYRAVVCIAPKDSLYEKMVSNIEEIHARKGKILAITDEADDAMRELADKIILIPHAREELYPLCVPVVLQLLAYFVASNLQHDIDQPRNLAKSVTVE